jgi:predicted transcriptional regulator
MIKGLDATLEPERATKPRTPKSALTHPLRARIHDRIAECPGILTQELSEQLGCNRSTLRHHLTKLQEAGIVHVVASKQRAHVFLSSMAPERQDALAVLQRGRTWELALEVVRTPGQAQCDLTQRLRMSRKILRKYVNRLQAEGLIREIDDPPFLLYYPTRSLLAMVEKWGPATQPRRPEANGAVPLQMPMPEMAQVPRIVKHD